MKSAPTWRRRLEITLWVIGLSLLGVALGATFFRWYSQAGEKRQVARAMEAYERTATPATPPPIPPADRTVLPPVETVPADSPAPSPAEASAEVSDTPPKRVELPGDAAPPPSPIKQAEKKPAVPSLEEAITLDPALLGQLEIPRLGFSAIVREGDDESTFSRAVGYLPDTARPGEGGNTGLAAHRDSFFRPLRNIKVDDTIRLVVPPHVYEYRVSSLQVVKPDEVSVLDSTGSEELTLVTCYPFRYIGPAPDRFIVKATRVQ